MSLFIDRDGARLHYEVGGQGKGLVLIHEQWGTVHAWDPQWGAFTAGHRVLRYDQRRHGDTTCDPEVAYFPTDDLFAMMDAVGIDGATLVGAGYGGSIGVGAALHRPDRVRGMVLVNSQPAVRNSLAALLPAAKAFYAVMFRRALGDANDPPSGYRAALARRDREMVADIISASPPSGPVPQFPVARATVRDMAMANRFLVDRPKHRVRWHVENAPPRRLRRLGMPCLSIIGCAQVPLFVDMSRKLAKQLECSEVLIEPHNTQWMNLEEPERFTKIVLDWLAAHDL